MGQVDPCRKHGLQHRTFGPVKLLWSSGVAVIASAALLFSCTSLAVKLLGTEVPTFEVVLVPGLICFIATSAAVKSHGMSVRSKSWRIAGLTILRGLLGAASITCFYLAIGLLPLQDAVTLFFCNPVLAALLELIVTGESQGWACATATACTVAGVVLVAQPPCIFIHHHGGSAEPHGQGQSQKYSQAAFLGSHTSVAGVALAALAALSNASAFVVIRLMKRSQSTLVLTWWYHGVVVLVSSIPLSLNYPAPPVLPSLRGCVLLLVVGITQFLGQLLLNRGFHLESATRGSAINVLQVLFSLIWDAAVLGDKPSIVSIAGSSLVVAGVVFMALTGSPPQLGERHGHPRHHHQHADSDMDEERPEDPNVAKPLIGTRPLPDGVGYSSLAPPQLALADVDAEAGVTGAWEVRQNLDVDGILDRSRSDSWANGSGDGEEGAITRAERHLQRAPAIYTAHTTYTCTLASESQI
ncbi:hypothetical protein VaNZ11_003217 [Volvox africanus]|uniref:EamA domain-containing protein n=1 Tax=Volvox africanus TaxID=51714 RepID=A0ABQ5RUS9_9CHLO|nr:hypothetical protein VaNZ11_003217 [Volvox africanus]